MTQRDLRSVFDLHEKIRKLNDIQQGLLKIASSSEDPELEHSIEILSQEIAEIKKEIDLRRPSIEDTLTEVEDISGRTILRLRFLHGLSWKEVSLYVNMSNVTARSAAYRALNMYIPK